KSLQAVQIGSDVRSIECHCEVIPVPGNDARTEASFDDSVSSGIRCFESNDWSANPKRYVVSRSKPDGMFEGVWPIVPIDPEGQSPLPDPCHRSDRRDLVIPPTELPRATDLPRRINCTRDRPVSPVPGEVLH